MNDGKENHRVMYLKLAYSQFNKYANLVQIFICSEKFGKNINGTDAKRYFNLTSNPFDNCQIFSIGNAQVFNQIDIDELKDCISIIKSLTNKNLMMIDISKGISENIMKNIIKLGHSLVSNTSYTNKTGNEMSMLIFDVRSDIIVNEDGSTLDEEYDEEYEYYADMQHARYK